MKETIHALTTDLKDTVNKEVEKTPNINKIISVMKEEMKSEMAKQNRGATLRKDDKVGRNRHNQTYIIEAGYFT